MASVTGRLARLGQALLERQRPPTAKAANSSSVAPEFAYSYGTLLSNTALDDTQNQCDWHGAEGPAQRLLWLPSSTAPTQSPCWLRLETGYLSLVP